ncbi:MAG TPA: hypothetical protein VFV02_16215 [Acidimicrobiales bacterium]|nr:hypothetical protein [Acidimicrobiales bacterium]
MSRRLRLGATAAVAGALLLIPSLRSDAIGPVADDPLGPLTDVTAHWRDYQPSGDFCVRPDVAEYPVSPVVATGANPACRQSGFATTDTGLLEVKMATPPLCAGCRRLFIDYSKIPADEGPLTASHGHAYFRPMSLNPTYTVAPTAHSPNIKNLSNDYLVAPPGSPSSVAATFADYYDMAYVADTAHTAHTNAQGPYYIGPWYLNQAGQRIYGDYLDVDLGSAQRLPAAGSNDIIYGTGFDSDPPACLDASLLGSTFADGNYFYGGCINWFGYSALPGVDPWAGPQRGT